MKKDCIPKNDKPVVKIGKRKSNLNTQKYNAHNKLDLDFGSILDCLDQGIRIIDKDSYILYINLAFAELSGILPKNAVGHKCWEVFQSPFCHTPNCQLKRILGGEAIVQSEIERIINNGITVPCLVSGFPLRSHDGELVGIMESFLDIRENKKTEKIIDNQNALLKAIINSNPDFLIFSLNANYCYTIFNDNHKNEMRRIWNVDIQEGMNLLDCMTDERTRLLAKESMDRALYGETFTEVQRQEPQDIFYEFNWSPVRRSSGEVIGLTSFVKDVTSLRRAQEQIKESEEQYRALIDLGSKAGEAIVMVQDINGAEGIQTFVSDQWATITGYTRTELLGMSFFDLLIPADQADSVFRHRQKMSGIAVPGLFEMGIICKDKSQKPIELTGAFTTYQGEKANVLYIRDISSRKALERALEDERDKYRTLFDDAPIALWEMDYTLLKKFVDDFRSNGKREIREYFDKNPEDFLSIVRSHKMVRFNKAYLDLFEAENEDELNQKTKAYFFEGSDNYNALKDDYVRLANGEKQFIKEEPILTTKGNRKYIRTLFATAPDFEDTWSRVFVALIDITERKIAEDQLKSYEEHLEAIVKERTARMEQEIKERKLAEEDLQASLNVEERLRKELERQMDERVRFTRALVHELKTPLTPLLAAHEFLTSNLSGENKEFALSANRSALKLQSRINELLDLSKGEVGLLDLKRQSINPLELVEHVMNDARPLIEKNGQSLRLEHSSLPISIWADEERLEQVLLNLIDNSVKFNRKHGLVLVRADMNDGKLNVSVSDEGLGIDKQEFKNIFEPYNRIKKKENHAGGLGLGLALSKLLVELHGGEIQVKSEKGKGSTFTVILPL